MLFRSSRIICKLNVKFEIVSDDKSLFFNRVKVIECLKNRWSWGLCGAGEADNFI